MFFLINIPLSLSIMHNIEIRNLVGKSDRRFIPVVDVDMNKSRNANSFYSAP